MAALYLPSRDAKLAFELFMIATATSTTHEPVARLVDDAAWRLAVHGVSPLVICGDGRWLMDHPFNPPAKRWLLLPLARRSMLIACTA